MNQDPNNPIMSNPVAPQLPTNPTVMSNPAAAAAPSLESTPATAAPTMPEAPTLDVSLLQEAIADVPEEAAVTTPDVPSAVSLDNIGAASGTPNMAGNTSDVSPFTATTSTTDFYTSDTAQTASTDINNMSAEEPKTTPSVAFNDPAQQPDNEKHRKDINLSSIAEKLKKHTVLVVFGGGFIIILILVLILAFAV